MSQDKPIHKVIPPYENGPTFDKCQGDCTKEVNGREFQLSCTVHGTKPNVTISLKAAGKSDITLLPASFETREDGTSDQTVYANVSMSSDSNSEAYTCNARGEAVQGMANATITVTVKSGGLSVGAIVAVIAIPLIVLGLVCFLVFKLTRKKRESLEKLRTQIRTYKPGDATESELSVNKVNLGLFGVMSTGKSAFINSVMFALTGEYHKHADETTDDLMADGIVTKEKTPYHLTSHITLFDNRGLQTYLDDTTQYMDQMRYNVSERIHCPIHVADARGETATNDLNGFLIKFPEEVEKLCGVKMKYVFTHKTDMESNGRDPRKLFQRIPEEDMILVENYTHENHEEDVERSTELLKFILSCLERAKCNIESMDRKEKERKEEQLRKDMQFAPAGIH
ncbi:uncharacterized protein [Diadema setosum]|uniref:uncharacterized protein n=1 Tax=Diadema setosum TaxID=31175 RepID=UPI003B3B5D80